MNLRNLTRSWYTFVVVERFGYRRPLDIARVTDADRAILDYASRETRKIRAALMLLDADVDIHRRVE